MTELLPIDEIDIQARIRGKDDELEDLAESIKRYGILQPLLLNQHNTLVDGWRRFTAAQIAGLTHVPVHRREQMSEAEYFELELETNIRRRQFTWRENVKAVTKVHNTRKRQAILSNNGEWTMEMTGELLGGYSKSYVWNCLEVEPHLDEEAYKGCESLTDAVRVVLRQKEDAAVALMAKRTNLQQVVIPTGVIASQQPPTELSSLMADPGELIVTLSQSLFCGDSIRDILPKWPDACVDHIITDPPFAIDVDMLQQSQQALIDVERVRDTHQVEENLELHALMFPLFYRILKDCGFLILWCDIMQWQRQYDLATASGFRVQRWPHVWCKTSQCKNQMAYQNETKATEFAMLCRKGNATLHTPVLKNYTLCTGLDDKLSNPFAKPYEAWEPLISAVSIEGQLVLDPFAGEGTCPRAALRLRRPVVAIEKDETHFNYMLESVKTHWKSVNEKAKFI